MRLVVRTLRHTISAALTVAIVVSGTPFAPAPVAAVPPPVTRTEVLGQRTEYSKTFELSDGTNETEFFMQPVHYRSETTTTLLPIDASLEETMTSRGTFFSSRANAFRALLPTELEEGFLSSDWVSVETSSARVAFRPASRPLMPEAAAANDADALQVPFAPGRVDYPGAYEGASLEYVSGSGGVKETIVLDRYMGRNVYSFDLISEGLTPSINEAGGIDFVSAESTTPVFEILPPIMEDSSEDENGEPAVTRDVRYELQPGLSGWRLDVVADKDWLASSERVYPVRIDPTILYAWISRAYGTDMVTASNRYPSQNMHWWYEDGVYPLGVGQQDGYYYRSFIKSSILDDAFEQLRDLDRDMEILYARLALWSYTQSPNPKTVMFNKVLGSWNADTITWNNQPSTSFEGSFSQADDATSDLYVTDIAREWYDNPGTNHGIMLWGDTGAGYCRYVGWDVDASGNPGDQHPFFRLAWTTVPKVSIVSPAADVTVDGDPTIVWDYDDDRHRVQSDGALIRKPQESVQFQVSATPGAANLIDVTKPNYTLPAYTMTESPAGGWEQKRYFLRMRASGSTEDYEEVWSDWTEWQPFTYSNIGSRMGAGGIEAHRAADSIGAGASVELQTGSLIVSREDLSGPARGGSLSLGTTYRSDEAQASDPSAAWRTPAPTLVKDDNQASDPSFSLSPGTTGAWGYVDGDASVSRVTGGRTGTYCWRIYKSAIPPTTAYLYSHGEGTAAYPVYPGQHLDASAWVKTTGFGMEGDSPYSDQYGALIKVHFWGADGAYLGTDKVVRSGNFADADTSGAWVQLATQAVAPPGAYFARMNIEYANAWGTLYVDDAHFGDGEVEFTDGDGTVRTMYQVTNGAYTRDPLVSSAGLEYVNLAAGADITTPKGSFNDAPDPGFDKSLATGGWYVSNAAITSQQTTAKRTGTGALRFASSVYASGYVSPCSGTTASMMPCVAGEKLYASMWIDTYCMYRDTSQGESGILLKMHYYNSSGVLLGSYVSPNSVFYDTNGWRQVAFSSTAPATAAYVKFNIEYRNCKGTLNVDDVELGKGTVEADRSTDGLCSSSTLGYDMVAADTSGVSYMDFDLGRVQVLSTLRLGLWDFQVDDPGYDPGPSYTYRVVVADTAAGLANGTQVVAQTTSRGWVEHDFDPVEARFIRVYALGSTVDHPFRLIELEAPQWQMGKMPVFFDDEGKLAATVDESGNITTLGYDAAGDVVNVSDESGRSIIVNRDGEGKPQSLDWCGIDSDGTGQTETGRIQYESDGATSTVRADDGGGARDVVSYHYDSSGRIDSITDADGVAIGIEYDASERVSRVTYADGSTRSYAYDLAGGMRITVADASQQQSLVTATTFSSITGLVSRTVTDPDGVALTTQIAYDCYGHVRSVTDPESNVTTTYTDAHGNAVWTDEAGQRTTRARYEDDLVIEARDAKDNVSTYQYDDARRLLSASQAISEAPADEDGGESANYSTYDDYGNQTTGNLPGSTSVNLLLNGTFERDPLTAGNGWDPAEDDNALWVDPGSVLYLGDHHIKVESALEPSYVSSTRFEIDQEKTYALSAWARGTGMIKVYEYNEEGDQVGVRYPVVFSSPVSTPFRRVSGMYWPHTDREVHEVKVVVFADTGARVDLDNIRMEMATRVGGDNYCDNASFEQVANDLPITWERRSATYTTAEHSASYDMAVSGARSARIKTTDGNSGYFYSDWVPVSQDEEYSVSGYIKTQDVESASAIDVKWYNSNKVYMSVSTAVGSASGDSDWTRYVANADVPDGACFARIALTCSAGEGTTYFDAVALESARSLEVFDYDDETSTYQVAADSVTGHRTTSVYDARGRETEAVYEAVPGQDPVITSASEFDGQGRLAAATVMPGALAEGDITASYAYTAAGRLWKVTDPLGRVYEMDYDTFGRLSTVKDPLGYYSRTIYDGLGRVSQVMRPSVSATSSVPLTTSKYDTAGRSSGTDYHDASGTVVATRTAQYDDNSNVTEQSLTYAGQTLGATTSYDVLNRPYSGTSSGPAGSLAFETTYDDADLPLVSTWTAFGGEESVENVWVKTNELKTTKLASSLETWYFAFDVSGAMTRAGGGIGSHMRTYDAAGRLTSVELGKISTGGDITPWALLKVTNDEWERIGSVSTDFWTGTDAADTYGYDEAGRLDTWTRTGFGAGTASYGFDRAGNLVSKSVNSVATTYEVNDANQLTSSVSGSVTTDYDYDELGRLVSTDDGSVETSYTWNDLGQLSQISDGQTTSTYAYGIDGMRQSKVVDDGTAETTTLQVWSGTKLMSEYDEDTDTRYDYLYGPNGMPLEMMVTSSDHTTASYAYQLDVGGSVIGITDADGVEVARYAYDPYGNVVAQTGASQIAARNPLRYRGYYLDTETGLYYLPARYYDPQSARFVSADPAPPSAGSPESLNRYTYCTGDPVASVDKTGAVADIVYECDKGSNAGLHVINFMRKGGSALTGYSSYHGRPTSYRDAFGRPKKPAARQLPGGRWQFGRKTSIMIAGSYGKFGLGATGGIIVNNTDWEYIPGHHPWGASVTNEYLRFHGKGTGAPGPSVSITRSDGHVAPGRYEVTNLIVGGGPFGSSEMENRDTGERSFATHEMGFDVGVMWIEVTEWESAPKWLP